MGKPQIQESLITNPNHMPLVTRHSPVALRHVFALVLLAALAAGCSGINARKSVSPLDFILPGLLQNSPPPPVIPLQTNTATLLAQASHGLSL